MNIRPLGDRIVVRPIEPPRSTESGLLLPENAQEKSQEGIVVAVGAGVYQNGFFIETTVDVDQRVLFAKYAGTEIKLDGETLLILRESDILCMLN